MRFVTPYRVSTSLSEDLSLLAPILEGRRLFRLFIDTWVGPGHPQGSGWLVSARLLIGEKTGEKVDQVIILNSRNFEYGNPDLSSSQEFPAAWSSIDFDRAVFRAT